jgi:hypothetical protein
MKLSQEDFERISQHLSSVGETTIQRMSIDPLGPLQLGQICKDMLGLYN